MFIFNTTFAIEESRIEKCLKYIQTEYIPNMTEDGFTNGIIMKIHTEQHEDGYRNYAVQFAAASEQFIKEWQQENEKEYISEIRKLFGEKVLTFSTIMETI